METTGYRKTGTLREATFAILLGLLKTTCIKHYSWYAAQITELQTISITQFSACDPCNIVLNIGVPLGNSTIQNHNPNSPFSSMQHLTMQYSLGREVWWKRTELPSNKQLWLILHNTLFLSSVSNENLGQLQINHKYNQTQSQSECRLTHH